ncbi:MULTISPECIES: type IV pilin [Methanocalculus]|uniref:type IV pilin n=1 Tax=Methanocalculus TaxID=71151 RepID=UPI00209DF11A|nr:MULTISPECIES: type IV pilin N-terminal domain-containing protein [unclassified Methanocalculus]MCP1661536.1 FlaG/FlaF family flagellin (archaellin) [Methanocalculus sp. AMF5]
MNGNRENDAVSPVVGTIVLVAVAILVAVIVSHVAFSTTGVLESPKIAAVTVEFTDDSYLYFRGGGDLRSLSSVTLTGDGRAGAYVFADADDPDLKARYPERETVTVTDPDNVIQEIVDAVRDEYDKGNPVVVVDLQENGESLYAIAFPQDGVLPGPFAPGYTIPIFPGIDMLEDPRRQNRIVVTGTWPDGVSVVLFSKMYVDPES